MSTAHTTKHVPQHDYYIGLMSGTSMDGVDGVVVDLAGDACKVIAHHSLPFSASLKAEMLALNTAGDNELHRASLATNQLMLLYAQVVAGLLYTAELESADIRAIGAHGQTVRHCPSGSVADGGGYTMQLNNPALLAERTGIDVVADFRGRDVAAGGQGAPLVPAFHKAVFDKAVFGQASQNIAVLNIGGIANVSLLHADGSVQGFDTGPGNVLMDAWTMEHTGMSYDAHGAWAASGSVSQPLLDALLRDAYFSKPIPKSTGRDLFHGDWLQACLATDASFASLDPADVQATLTELTAQSIGRALSQYGQGFAALYVCGGGALNDYLMQRLRAVMPNVQIETTDALGIPVMQVEAAAFAWLAKQCVNRVPLDLQKITGARGSRVLGAVYPA